MAIKTLAQLRIDAQVIKNEVTTGANTAIRVGTFMDEALESLDKIQGHGWSFSLDSRTSLGGGQTISAGEPTKLIIDGGLEHIHSPNWEADGTHVWNTVSSTFYPLVLNDFYMMRLAITAESAAQTNQFEIEFDVGSGGTGGTNIIAAETAVFAKGANTSQSFNFSTGLFAGGDFVTNGGKIYITPESETTFWQAAMTISRTYTPAV